LTTATIRETDLAEAAAGNIGADDIDAGDGAVWNSGERAGTLSAAGWFAGMLAADSLCWPSGTAD